MKSIFRVSYRLLTGARLARISTYLLAVVLLGLILSVGALQMLQKTGSQLADQLIGRAAGVVQIAGYSTLGSTRDTNAEDTRVDQALEKTGQKVLSKGWLALQLHLDADLARTVNLEENNWGQAPFPQRLRLVGGIWASRAGEVTVSKALAQRFPVGSTVSIASGALRLQVVGVAVDDLARSQPSLFVGPGTWSGALKTAPAAVRTREISAQRLLFYSRAAQSDRLTDAVTSAVPSGSNQQAIVFDRAEAEAAEPPDYFEQNLLVLFGPLVGGFLSGLIVFRSFNRHRAILWSIGVPYRKTRLASAAGVATMASMGWAGGVVGGLLLVPVLRISLDANLDARPNSVHDLPWLVVITLPGMVVGLVGAGIMTRNRSLSSTAITRAIGGRQEVARRYGFAGPVIAGLLAILGIFSSQGSRDPNALLLAATLFGMAFVVIAPLLLKPLLRIKVSSLTVRLAMRRLRVDRSFGLPLIASSLLLLVATGSMTFINSSVEATNASNLSTVLPGQVQVRSDAAGGMKATQAQVENLRSRGSLPNPLLAYDATASVADFEGPVIAVNSAADASRFLGSDLDATATRALQAGYMLRPVADDVRFRSLRRNDGLLRVRTVPFAAPDAAKAWGGLVLRASLQEKAVDTSDKLWIFTGLSASKIRAVRLLAENIGISASSLSFYAPPDRFSMPLAAAAIALGLMLVNALILAASSSADTRRLRPSLAGLRAVGVSSSWIRGVVAVRTLIATGVPLLVALIGAVIGVAAAIASSGVSFRVAVPFGFLFPIYGAVIISGVAVGVVSSSRLGRAEWQLN